MDLGIPAAGHQTPLADPQARFSTAKNVLMRNAGAFRVAGLVGILLFSFWAGMAPRWDYPYPLHVDEWFAIGYAQSTLDAGGLEYPNPYGRREVSFHPEMGFHLLLGFLKTTTGLSWMSLYRVAPGILLALLAFLTYAFARRLGFGWAAALFIPLIPTSVRTLGPAFVVPVSAAMLFIPVTLLLLHTMKERSDGKSLWLLLLLIGGTIFVHPPTEAVVTALAVLYLAGYVGEALAHRRFADGSRLLLAMGVRILIPVVVLGLWIPSLTKKVLADAGFGGSGLLPIQGPHSGFFEAFGVVGVALAVVGLVFFFVRREDGVRSYFLPIYMIFLTAFLIFYPAYQVGPDILYDRGWSYLGLLLAIFAGYGIAFYFRSITYIARSVVARFGRPLGGWAAVSLWWMGGAMVILALTTGLLANGKRDAYPRYYHVINERVFSDFRWVGQHTVPGQIIAMGEPSIGWAYPPVAGPEKTVFLAASSPFAGKGVKKLRRMLGTGEVDVPWLRKSGVSVFYTCRPRVFTCEELTGNDLFKVRRGVYLIPGRPGEG